jgi:hypothetical protein
MSKDGKYHNNLTENSALLIAANGSIIIRHGGDINVELAILDYWYLCLYTGYAGFYALEGANRSLILRLTA